MRSGRNDAGIDTFNQIGGRKIKYLVSFFNGLHFGHAVFQLDKLDEKSIDYIVSELEKTGEEPVVIIGITRLEK